MYNSPNHIEPREANHTTSYKSDLWSSPAAIATASENITHSTANKSDITPLVDSITEHVRIAKIANLIVAYTPVTELTELLPVILSRHPSNMRITIHTGSFDILRRKTVSKVLKKDFSLPLEKLSDCQSQHALNSFFC